MKISLKLLSVLDNLSDNELSNLCERSNKRVEHLQQLGSSNLDDITKLATLIRHIQDLLESRLDIMLTQIL